MKTITPNYEIQKQSVVFNLKDTYSKYVKAVHKSLQYAGFNANGDFYVLDGQEERNAEVKRLEKEMMRLQFKLQEIENESGN